MILAASSDASCAVSPWTVTPSCTSATSGVIFTRPTPFTLIVPTSTSRARMSESLCARAGATAGPSRVAASRPAVSPAASSVRLWRPRVGVSVFTVVTPSVRDGLLASNGVDAAGRMALRRS